MELLLDDQKIWGEWKSLYNFSSTHDGAGTTSTVEKEAHNWRAQRRKAKPWSHTCNAKLGSSHAGAQQPFRSGRLKSEWHPWVWAVWDCTDSICSREWWFPELLELGSMQRCRSVQDTSWEGNYARTLAKPSNGISAKTMEAWGL